MIDNIPFRAVLEHTNDVILITEAANISGPDGPKIVYVNQAFTKLTGYSKEEAIGQTPRILQGPRTDRKTLEKIKQALEQRESLRVELINYAKNGSEYWLDLSVSPLFDQQGMIQYFAAVQRDVSDKKQLQNDLIHLSSIDPLTGAINRRRFIEVASDAINRMHRNKQVFGLMLIDIDNFKQVNEFQGNQAGDGIIQQIARICKKVCRATDYLCRFGGDEFVILLHDTSTQGTINKAKTLSNFILDERRYSVSIGATVACLTDKSIDETFIRAEQALSYVKEKGKGFSYFVAKPKVE